MLSEPASSDGSVLNLLLWISQLISLAKFYNTCFPAFFALILSILCTHSRCKIKYFRQINVSDTVRTLLLILSLVSVAFQISPVCILLAIILTCVFMSSIICVHNCRGGSLFPVIPNSYLCRSFQAVYDGLHCALSCCYVYTSRSTPTCSWDFSNCQFGLSSEKRWLHQSRFQLFLGYMSLEEVIAFEHVL